MPTPKDDEVLIRVRAASINPYDYHFMRGTPYLVRLMAGMRKPKVIRLGVDVAGEVEAMGSKVTQFKPGDAVFGMCRGALAEYACTAESRLATKPDNVTFEQAASVPIAGLTALQGLRDYGRVQPGQKVLINGAAGGVGTFAMQIAKSFGAEVTGVCSTRNVEMVRSIGGDHVVDYTREDFTTGEQRYDVILDCIGNHSFRACRRVLNPKGTHIAVGGPAGGSMISLLAGVITGVVSSWFVSQKFALLRAKAGQADLTILGELMQAGKITPVVDRRYSLQEAPAAFRYLEEGHARGKVVIAIENHQTNA